MILSIITVTKNCVATLDRTLASIDRVKTDGIEYIVVDGESTDGTLELVKSHVGLVDQWVSEPDSGIYDAMNKGVKMATGRYVLFLNGDDSLSSDGFSTAFDRLEASEAGIVSGRCHLDGEDAANGFLIPSIWRLLFINTIPHPSTFARRNLLLARPFRTDFRIAADYEFFLVSYLNRVRFELLDDVIANHFRGGVSSDVERSMREVEQIREERLGWKKGGLDIISRTYRSVKRVSKRLGVGVR